MALDFGKLNFSTSFKPTSAFPLDARCYFESLALAEEAAASAMPAGDTTTVYYYGMTLCVVENDAATLYIIQPDKTLEEVGSVPVGDGLSIEVVDGEIKIKGFGDKYFAYVPAEKDEETGEILTASTYEERSGFKAGLEPRIVLNDHSDYEIAWYEPSTETIEGVNTKVDTVVGTVDTIEGILNGDGSPENPGVVKEVDDLQDTVATVEEDVAALEEKVGVDGIGEAATGLYKAVNDLKGRVDTAEDEIDQLQTDVAGKANSNEVYTKEEADTAIATAIAGASHLKREIVNVLPIENIDENTIYMVPKANGAQGEDAYNEYMYLNETWELIGDTVTDLADYAKTEDVYTKEEANVLLGAKVDAVEGKELSSNDFTDELAEKLAGIAAGAEVNIVKSVEQESGLALSETGVLSLSNVAQEKITGLAEALAGKVDVEEGKSLISDALITKLQGIAEGAQVNVLEGVQVNGTDLTIDENKKVNIPLAGTTAGTVVSSDDDGKIKVGADGTMSVNNLDISLLTQSEDLILDGGSSGASSYE